MKGAARAATGIDEHFPRSRSVVPLRDFARAIGEVYAARPTQIVLDHAPDQEHIAVERYIMARTTGPVLSDTPVSFGIPGHDQPGQEIIAEAFQVGDLVRF